MELTKSKLAQIQERGSLRPGSFATRWVPWLLVAFFTCIYFGRTLLRAAGKPFWYDELCTLYLARLPTFADAWAAQLHGIDYNPPFFHLIHRAARALVGDGPIALRLPEIVSFWIFSICLFRFVAKRAGYAAGWIAMALPMLTGAYYYATEARAYALILGFLGLALVCWQELQEDPNRWGWRIAFAVSLAAAYFNHSYAVLLAVPFGLAEAWRTLRTREFRWREWITLFVPGAVAAASYVPLLHSYRTVLAPSGYATQHAVKAAEIPEFYSFVLAPCWFIVAIAVVVYIVKIRRSAMPEDGKAAAPPYQEIAVAAGLAAFPVLGITLAFVMRGPLFLRYLLPGAAGCVLLLAYGCIYRRAAKYVAIFVGILVFGHFLRTFRLSRKGVSEFMSGENSSQMTFTRHMSDPLEPYALVRSSASKTLPLAIRSFTEFLYFVYYAPDLKYRLYPVSMNTTEQVYILNKAFREWGHVDFNREQPIEQFVADHQDFALYGTKSDFYLVQDIFKHSGAEITSFQWGDAGHFLMTVHVPAR